MKMDVTLASLDEKSILQRLMELYLYDFSQFEDSDLDARGCYGYAWLDAYWSEKGRYPFLIRVEGKLAGFVLVNPYTCVPGSQWAIAEFFVMRKYRRRGVGKRAALMVFDLFRGKWEVRELENNIPAQHFWRTVISAYTGGQYLESSLNNEAWLGPVQCFDNSQPQPAAKIDAQMSAAEVISLLQLFNRGHIDVCVDGGWGVDALLGEQTRPHGDLDIALEHKDVPLLRTLLEARGYQDVPREDTRDCNFVMGDAQGHLVDIHSYTFDAAGQLIFGVAYPLDSLNGTGSINGQPLKCISPEWMVKFHSGYPLDENDYHDVKLLCRHFAWPLPAEYIPFEWAERQSLAASEVGGTVPFPADFLPSFPEVRYILQILLHSLQRILGSHLTAVYLDGSLASGDFDEDSDIDFVVVTDEDISGDLFLTLQVMHARMAEIDSRYAAQLEGSYLPQPALRAYHPAHALHPNLERGSGERLKMADHNQAWNIHRHVLRERGITLLGPPPETLIDPLTPNDLRQAALLWLTASAEPILEHPDQIDSRGFQSSMVLSLCCSLYTLQFGDVASKPKAASWAKAALGAKWHGLIDCARLSRHTPQLPADPEDIALTLDFIQYALDCGRQANP